MADHPQHPSGSQKVSPKVGVLPQTSDITRRRFLQFGVGAFGLMATSGLGWALECPSVLTPRQSRGPFYPFDHAVAFSIRENTENRLPLIEANDNDLTKIKGKSGRAQGQIIFVRGQVLRLSAPDESRTKGCQAMAGASIFLWQANFSGRYNHKGDESAPSSFPHPFSGKPIPRIHDENFQYWGKAISDDQGHFLFKTILPSFYPAAEDWYRPPHLHFSVRAIGYPEFVTQMYFKGDDLPNIGLIHQLNAKDWILRDRRISPDQQEQVIVDFGPDPAGMVTDGLVGTCQLFLPA